MKNHIPYMPQTCHELYREEIVGLKTSNYILEFLWICKIWGILWKFDILSITAHLKCESKTLLHIVCDTYNCDCLPHTTFRFCFIDFQLNTDFPSQFWIFYVKSSSVTQRSFSQENVFKKSKNPSPFSSQNNGFKYTIAYGKMHPDVTP